MKANGKRVLVLGDVMLDRYVVGDSTRISPEAPVPVVRPTHEETRAGGAANLALNLAALGMDVRLVGITGSGTHRRELIDLLSAVDASGLVTSEQRATTTKTRILAGSHQLLRLDHETTDAISPEDESALAKVCRERLDDQVDAVAISDYGKGTVAPSIARTVIDRANSANIPVFVDPTHRDYKTYAGATVVKPNSREFEEQTGNRSPEQEANVARSWMQRYDLQAMLITKGADGARWVSQTDEIDAPGEPCAVYDVTGAGDTALAALIDAYLRGWPMKRALRYVNHAAAAVVSQVGTCVVDPSGFSIDFETVDSQPDRDAWESTVEQWRAAGERVVFTNGCFDLLHRGHLRLLARARAAGDRLIVAVNTDDGIRRLKGPSRPVQPLAARVAVLENLADVDLVVPFSQPTPMTLIEHIRPDVLVKGADYRRDQVVGGAFVESYGGRVLLIPLVAGESTTSTIERMQHVEPAVRRARKA